MQIPDDEEFIRRAVQRKAAGKTEDEVAREAGNARERRHQAEHGPQGPASSEALRKAEWKHTEWRRIQSVMAEESLEAYDPGRDPVAVRWAREHERVAAQARARRQEAERLLPEGSDELYLFVSLRGAARRRVEELAARCGTSAEEIMIQLAANAEIDGDGRVFAAPFAPARP